MCVTCGCGGDGAVIEDHHAHHHHGHAYRPRKRKGAAPGQPAAEAITLVALVAPVVEPALMATIPRAEEGRRISLEQDILARNDSEADDNRHRLAAAGIFALNLVSSPGSGKTTLLVKTIERLAGSLPVAVIEGDQQTSFDAERIRASGAPAIQINTGKGCHLDARMVGQALERLPLPTGEKPGGLLLIENVGNLVCPAAFDLGEAHKVVILSVTEGEDKPLKYPDMFQAADLMLLNKCDLLPYLTFDAARAEAFARQVNPSIRIIRTSATTGEGLDEWLAWIRAGVADGVASTMVNNVANVANAVGGAGQS